MIAPGAAEEHLSPGDLGQERDEALDCLLVATFLGLDQFGE